MFTATHPPALTIHDIDIRDNDKGGLTIHFTVENIGRSRARIVKSATTDQVIGGDYNEGPWDAPDLVGQQITEHGFIRAEHVCVNIVPEDIVPIPIALPGIRAVADMSPVPTPVQKELNFGVFLAFADESGTHDFVTADRKCVVPSRRFPDSNG